MTALLYDLLYGLPLCLIALLTGGALVGAPQQLLLPLLVALLSFGICIGLKYWESRMKLLPPGLVLVVLVGITLVQPAGSRGEFLAQHSWVLWIGLGAALCFWLGRLAAEYPWVRRVIAIAFFADLMIALIRSGMPDKGGVALELFFLLLCMAEEVQLRWPKSGYTDRRGHLVALMPFLLLTGVLIFALPAPEKPFDWAFAVKVWEKTVDRIKLTNRFFHRNTENYGLVGFPESGSFWGNLQKKQRDVMELYGRSDVGPLIYLTGKVMDTFDGRDWSAAYQEAGGDRTLDTLESLCAVTMTEPDYVKNYLWRVEVRCRFDEFNTKYFFVPLKAMIGQEQIGEIPFVQRGGDLVAPEGLGYGSEYTVTYYRLNQGNEEVRKFLQNRRPVDRATWDRVRMEYDTEGGNPFHSYEKAF